MDLSQELIRPRPLRRLADETGLAMGAVLLGLVIILASVTAAFELVDLNRQGATNREESVHATQLAEGGLAHALGVLRGPLAARSMNQILRGSDNTKFTADDGLLIGYGLATASQIPAAGVTYNGGRYFVRLLDDPAETDGDSLTDTNRRILVTCRGVTARGASAESRVVVYNIVLPGVAVDGNLEVSSAASLTGACGGAHTNGTLFGGGAPSATAGWSSSAGTIPAAFGGTRTTGAAPLEIPVLDPLEYCADADFHIYGNFTLRSTTAAGTYCVHGNAYSSGDFGSWGTFKQVSIIATGSISISSKPFITADHPDGFVLLAGGDLDLQGDWGGRGVVYGGGHCYVSSAPRIEGQLICGSDPDPVGADDRTDQNLISGTLQLSFGCSSTLNASYRVVAWYPKIGT